jgi:hypothetical protein
VRDVAGAPARRVSSFHGAVLQREIQRLPLSDGEAHPRRARREIRVHRRGEPQQRGPAVRDEAAGLRDVQRGDDAELGARAELRRHLHVAALAAQAAQQRVRRLAAQVVAALVRAAGQQVRQHNHARVRLEAGLQHQRPVDVAARRRRLADRSDRPVAALVVQQPGEDRRRVEAREAEPVDRASTAHQRRRVAVGEQRVIGDRAWCS